MPADQPGRTQAGTKAPPRRRPRKRTPKRDPWKGASHVGTGYSPGTGQTAKPKSAAPPLKTPKFRPDDKSDAERHRADKFKRSAKYHKTLRDVYEVKSRTGREQVYEGAGRAGIGGPARFERQVPGVGDVLQRRPERERRRLLVGDFGGGDVATYLREEHHRRVARNRELEHARALHDITTDADWRTVDRFKGSDKYRDLLERTHTGGGVAGFLERSFRNVYGGEGGAQDERTTAATITPPVSTRFSGLAGGIVQPVAQAFAEELSTGKGRRRFARQNVENLASIPAGVLALAAHPGEAPGAIGQSYAHRYGRLLAGDVEAYRKQARKEGVAQEASDVVGLVGGGGAALGRGAGVLARAGALGKTAERISAARPGLMVSTGEIVDQATHPNLFRNVVRAGVDRARRAGMGRRLGRDEAPLLDVQARNAGAVTRLTKRGRGRGPRKLIATGRGRDILRMKTETQTELREHDKVYRGLDKKERRGFKYAMQYGLTTPRAAKHLLRKHRDEVLARRQAVQDAGGRLNLRHDEIPEINWLIDHADEVFTSKLGDAIKSEGARMERIARDDPGVDVTQAELRRHGPQAKLLGVERRYAETPEEFRSRRRALQDKITSATRRVQRAKVTSARHEGRAEVGTAEADRRLLRGDKAYVRAAKSMRRIQAEYRAARKAHGNAHRNPDLYSPAERRAIETRAADAERELKQAKATFERVKQEASKRVERELGTRPRGQVGATERARAALHEAERDLAGLRDELKNLTRRSGESHEDYLSRVKEAARAHDVAKPGYIPSEERPAGVFSAFALGGRKAVAGTKRWEGKLQELGIENNDAEVFRRGVARGIKRRYNWNNVADNFDAHADPELRNMSVKDLQRELDIRGIDHNSVAFWNPRLFREMRAAVSKADEEIPEGDVLLTEDPTTHAALQQAVVADLRDPRLLATDPENFVNHSGWTVVPREVYDEIHADTRPSGALGRSFDIAKGKLSRWLLANPAWLQFQIGSNALLTGLAGTGPVDAIKAQFYWRKLTEAQKQAVEPYLGIHRWFDEQTHLGASANNGVVNAWRALKQTPLWRLGRKGNPLDLIFKADNAQNNFFRKAVFYNEVKKQAYKDMGREMGGAVRLQHQLMGILGHGPKSRMQGLIDNADDFARHAEHVNKFLGDYMSYTAKERRTLGRAVMFYGFLRFSVKFTFWTMPVEHPILSAMLMHVGNMEREEQARIFGADVPPWEIGNFYTEDGRRIQTARLNPFFNALQYEGPGSPVGMLSPLASLTLNQVYGKNALFDRPYRVGGKASYVTKSSELGPLLSVLQPGSTRNRVAAEEFLRVLPGYRQAEAGAFSGLGIKGLQGRQSDDTLLFDPRPIKYVDPERQAEQDRLIREQRGRQGFPAAREQVVPIIPVDARERIRAARRHAEEERKKKRKKGGGKPDLLGGGSSSSNLPDLLK